MNENLQVKNTFFLNFLTPSSPEVFTACVVVVNSNCVRNMTYQYANTICCI